MAIGEFDLIKRYFEVPAIRHACTQLGIGDDCALLNIPNGYQLAVTTDTMVEHVHFFADVDPQQLGHKLLAVNLSDLAAMGAEPIAVTLAMSLPRVDEQWLASFSTGFKNLARQYHLDLIGGDTTAGPLTLTVQALGLIPSGQALLRSTAKIGDLIYLSGNIGNAGLGLKIQQGYVCANPEQPLYSLHTPQPRIALGQALRNIASSCIDISDGLAADLGHILQKSAVGAILEWDKLRLSAEVRQYIYDTGDWQMPLTAGDDYELCFTVPRQLKSQLDNTCVCIGEIQTQPGLRLLRDGHQTLFQVKGYEHFT
ncbi:thiamine-phosphate kinase [Methylomonas paludis]|uniref:Thiamine-monophosphate kinase n=1 Tax=Methylomonas paludis TaxID=1173101 RepID=A0A975MN17_9GAMM|nr:thiamine-phosphate kinase [Methylomonas paludis]QWF70361.1 thiamine-phosphate kinase [Methylomonas paludis]